MRKLTMAAIGAACLVFGAGGATLFTHAATGPAVYIVYEANVTDEDAYKKATFPRHALHCAVAHALPS